LACRPDAPVVETSYSPWINICKILSLCFCLYTIRDSYPRKEIQMNRFYVTRKEIGQPDSNSPRPNHLPVQCIAYSQWFRYQFIPKFRYCVRINGLAGMEVKPNPGRWYDQGKCVITIASIFDGWWSGSITLKIRTSNRASRG
jgi:hypothetical protein